MRRRSSTPRAKAIKLADDECRELVMLLEPNCVTCDKPGRGQWSHYISKGHHNTRWDLRNTHNQCYTCHIVQFHLTDPTAYHDFILSAIGQEEFDKMRTLGNAPSHFKTADILAIAESLRQRRLELEGKDA